MARTSKMNMIMHGDGHGGVHHHDGFINVNGIFEGRFDIILTNPPFGANVEESDIILESDIGTDEEAERLYSREFGKVYIEAQARVRAAKGKPIASLFELPKNSTGKRIGKTKTEILFIERCLSLLKSGGRMGVVLPEGVFNNPSLAYVREFCENRAYIKAVISLPQETFFSIGASVKASLLFMQKFTEKEKIEFDKKRTAAEAETRAKYKEEIERETARLNTEIEAAKGTRDTKQCKALRDELHRFKRAIEDRIKIEFRALSKERFPYAVFLYEAEKVGVTSTGEADQSELYPNPNQPPGTEGKTCLEIYHVFLKDSKPFLEGRA
jgi:type I restriction enzyme M protein